MDESEFMRTFRIALFSRIVPTMKEIGLWGPRIRKTYEQMGVLAFADTDVEALADQDQRVAIEFDRRRGEIEDVARAGAAG
jgi:hypothetical protein